jgi:hypothetical protein
MYKSSLKHIHDPVFSSLKTKGIRFLFTQGVEHKVYNAKDTNVAAVISAWQQINYRDMNGNKFANNIFISFQNKEGL